MKNTDHLIDIIGKIIVILLIGLFTFIGIAHIVTDKKNIGSSKPQRPAVQTKTITVSTIEIQPQAINRTVKLNGEVASKTEVNLYPHTGGTVSRLLIDEGNRVYKGDIIAYIDPSKPGSAYALSPVTATVGGTIISNPVNVGDTVTINTCIATVGSLTNLEIHVNVSEKYSSYLKQGLSAFISTVSEPDKITEATVTSISPVVDKTSRTLDVTLTPKKQTNMLKPGMFASVELIIQQENNTLVIPKGALKEFNDGYTVFCVTEDNTAVRVPVTIGLQNDTHIQITSGINIGDTVITAGSVTDGAPVRIAETISAI